MTASDEMPAAVKGTWLEEAVRRADEELHPDLVLYLQDAEDLFEGAQVLKHPLVFDIPFMPQLAYRDNDQYAAKQEALTEAKKIQDWHTVIWLHERPYRFQAFDEIKRKLQHRQYWDLLGQVWVDSENIWQQAHLLPALLGSQRPGRRYLMDPAEYKALKAMPEILRIYRGYSSRATRPGWSWTLSKEKAEWFSRRLLRPGDEARVAEGAVRRSDVIAYFTGRGEEEVVVSPRDVLLPQ